MKGIRRLRGAMCLLLAIGFLAVLAGCPIVAKKAQPLGKVYYTFFDTVSYIYSYAGDGEASFDRRTAAAAELFQEYHRLMDIYHEYSGVNNLCTVNRHAGGEAVEVDEKLIDFLLYAKELYGLTGGKMNVMLGAVVKPWHDAYTAATGGEQPAQVPDRELLARANGHTAISLLEIDPQRRTVRISDPEGRIDVGALGKGYATEMAARLLEEMGAESYVLNIGGNIRVIGQKPDGSGWTTGIKDPFDPDSSYAMYLELSDTSCVTSGIYERFFVADGVKYHHLIDPETLMPAGRFASVSVITQNSALADALSTALFCTSYEDGLALVEELEEVEVLWIFLDGTQKYTSGICPLDPSNFDQ